MVRDRSGWTGWLTCSLLLGLASGMGCHAGSTDPATDAGLFVDQGSDLDPGEPQDASTPALDGGPDSSRDTGPPGPPLPFFAFGTSPEQPVSAAPFPNDLYRQPDGTLAVAPLEEDPRLGPLGDRSALTRFSSLIPTRTGFGSTGTVWFPTTAAPELTSFAGRVRLITLAGPEAGREVAVQLLYQAPFGALGVLPDWGEYLVPGSTYAALVTRGARTAAGVEIEPHPALAELLAPTPPPPAVHRLHQQYAPLRAWLAARALDPADVLVATVFTTQEVLPYAAALLNEVDRFPLEPPTRRVRWHMAENRFEEAPPCEGAALDDYFGVALPPFEHNPGLWGGHREDTVWLPGYEQRYPGGTGHPGIGRLYHGTIRVPVFDFEAGPGGPVPAPLHFVAGRPVARLHALVPFTLYLCESHLDAPSRLPVAIFSHGGSALRADAVGWAAANCLAGVATIAIDMVFHGGRTETLLLDDELIVPIVSDRHNAFTSLREGDPGFVRDWIGDPGDPLEVVGGLFGVWQGADPAIIEAHLLTITTDTATLLRYLQEGDWSALEPGLSFDPDRIFHESLSFGTSFHTPLLALRDGFAGIIGSVGTGRVLSVNLVMAPSNAETASGVMASVLGLRSTAAELMNGSLGDPVLGLHQWLHERGDPMPYAPYLLRHRPSPTLPPVLHTCDSWDETLYPPAQVTYAAALGLPSYEQGTDWTLDRTIPGASRLTVAEAPAAPLVGNVTFGDRTTTAALFWYTGSCHALVHNAVCVSTFEHPYPPIRRLPTPRVGPSPLCAVHAQISGFLTSLLDGGPPTIRPPAGSCEEVYLP